MHVFKDVDNTKWKNPQVYKFELSVAAALPVIRSNGSKGGLLNLRRCSPEQLAFLQSHLTAQNVDLRSAREVEIKARKAREARHKKEEKQKEKERAEEMKKWRLNLKEVSETGGRDEDRRNEKTGYTHDPITTPPPPTPFSPPVFEENRPNPVYFHPYPSRYSSIPPPPLPPPSPPPPPPVINYPRRERHEKPTPLQQESDWELECIDLDLIPIVAKLKVKQLKTSSLGLEPVQENYQDYQRRQRSNRMPRLAFQLADSAKVEFAVVYSRTVMSAVSRAHSRRDNVIRYRTETEDGQEEESAYEYDSEQDMAEVLVGRRVGEEDEEEEEEEEDLEVVEGFDCNIEHA